MNNYRHGDIALIGIKELPTGLTKATTNIIIDQDQTSGGNAHSFKRGEIYFKNVDTFVFGYLEAKNTTLFHAKHGEGKDALKTAKVEDGIYELRRQNEETHEGMRVVVD